MKLSKGPSLELRTPSQICTSSKAVMTQAISREGVVGSYHLGVAGTKLPAVLLACCFTDVGGAFASIGAIPGPTIRSSQAEHHPKSDCVAAWTLLALVHGKRSGSPDLPIELCDGNLQLNQDIQRVVAGALSRRATGQGKRLKHDYGPWERRCRRDGRGGFD